MRLFIAITCIKETQSQLVKLQKQLATNAKGSFVDPKNFHLTLAFLGEQKIEKLPAIVEAIKATTTVPFTINIEGIGTFGKGIWWAQVAPSDELHALHAQLQQELAKRNLPVDFRGFTAHITLARNITGQKGPMIIKPFSQRVSSISLMESKRVNGKLVYTELYTHLW